MNETFDVFIAPVVEINSVIASQNWLATPSACCLDWPFRPLTKRKERRESIVIAEEIHFCVTCTSFETLASLPPANTTRVKVTFVVRLVVVNGLSAVMTK